MLIDGVYKLQDALTLSFHSPIHKLLSHPKLHINLNSKTISQFFSNTVTMVHKELNSKADFDAALATQGKYVLIYAYSGEVAPQAEA